MWKPTIYSDELYHHGILGMKWGVRRYQNPDGTLTAAGRRRLNMGEHKNGLTDDQKNKIKKVAIGAAVIGGTALAAYGAYKYSDFIKNKAYKQLVAEGAHYVSMMNQGGTVSQRAASQAMYGQKATQAQAKAQEVRKSFSKSLKYLNESKKPKKVIDASQFGKMAKKSEKEKAAKKMYDSIDSLKFAKQLSSNGKIRTDSVKDFNTVFGNDAFKSAPKVANTTAARATDLKKLFENSKKMQTMANESYKAATKSTESFDYAQELLKKNKGKLSGYNIMKDLKDLDLY